MCNNRPHLSLRIAMRPHEAIVDSSRRPHRAEELQHARPAHACHHSNGVNGDYSDYSCSSRGTVVERRSLTGELSLSCARPAADG